MSVIPAAAPAAVQTGHDPSRRSLFGLNIVNFFMTEMQAVVTPFLATYLKQQNWDYGRIGIATAIGGLGVFVAQIPAGIIADKITQRRAMLAVCSLLLGGTLALLPPLSFADAAIYALLFIGGAASAGFVPLQATLALSLAGPQRFDRVMGQNQGWGHAGNITAALLAFTLVHFIGVTSIFYVMGLVSALAASSLLLIRPNELHNDQGDDKKGGLVEHMRSLLTQKRILALVVSVGLFHFANAPALPLVALYLKKLGSGDDSVALVVFITQAVMIPVALLTARYAGRLGRKPVLAIAFLALPLRIVLYTLTTDPQLILAIQVLDAVGAGIYGVAICLVCGDVTRGKAGFNTLLGIMQTALALGGVVGPLTQGFLTERLGFPLTFLTLAGIAGTGVIVFLTMVPETKPATGEA